MSTDIGFGLHLMQGWGTPGGAQQGPVVLGLCWPLVYIPRCVCCPPLAKKMGKIEARKSISGRLTIVETAAVSG